MGFMDKFSKILGGKKSTATDSVKGPSQTLREHGIDPSNLKFKFNQDGSVDVSGQAENQLECNRICEVVEGIPGVSNVNNNITISVSGPVPVPDPEVVIPEAVIPEAVVPEVVISEVVVPEVEVTADEVKKAERTYTVASGDTLWAIAEKMYGTGGKYMKIFEANTSLLTSPDKIFPGQELVIPEL